ncbi:MAG: hypothetical protein ACREEH_04350 [Caulobacteraceae bacterium]
MPTNDVVILCSRGSSGGEEALHQLCDAMIGAGVRVRLLYCPFSRKNERPAKFAHYRGAQITRAEVPEGALIVIPEVYTWLVGEFPRSPIVIWWLSVDNYRGSKSLRYAVGNGFFGRRYLGPERLRGHERVALHLAQSLYALDFIERHAFEPRAWLSDYIGEAFLAAGPRVDPTRKDDIVLYNPAKLTAPARRFIEGEGAFRFQPIAGLTEYEVIDLLARAKVHIDFGTHPGKERIPREAATMGCCVLTNRRGSAPSDVLIPEMYQLDDDAPDFAARAHDLVSRVLDDFPTHHAALASYRAAVAAERESFLSEAAPVFSGLLGPTGALPAW